MISAPVFCPQFIGRQPELAFLVERRQNGAARVLRGHVSVELVEKHLSSIYGKLGFTSRSPLTAHIVAGASTALDAGRRSRER